jgi:hypothetical protein
MEFEFSEHFFGRVGDVTSESVPNKQAFSKQGVAKDFLQTKNTYKKYGSINSAYQTT